MFDESLNQACDSIIENFNAENNIFNGDSNVLGESESKDNIETMVDKSVHIGKVDKKYEICMTYNPSNNNLLI